MTESSDKLAETLARLMEEYEESGRPLTNAGSKIKAMGFVGGVRKPPPGSDKPGSEMES